jgi:hypothetical protein
MNKRLLGIFVLGLFAVILVSGFASAGWFGDFWGKMTGHAVSVSSNSTCKQMGDVNNDCAINAIDNQIVRTNFGKATSVGDTNGDGVVNAVDIQAVNLNFGKTCAQMNASCGSSGGGGGGVACTDSDGGIRPLVKGTVVRGNVSQTDSCSSSKYLTEKYCSAGGLSATTIDCLYSFNGTCSDGACRA